MKKDIIEELLSELIGKCESSMAAPFKKKVAEPEIVEEDDEPEVLAISVDKPEDEEEMDEETMQKLLEMYRKDK